MSVNIDNLLDVPDMKTSMLIRKSSFHSLVEIPTYITCHIHLKGLASDSDSAQPASDIQAGISLDERLSTYDPIVSQETRENMILIEQRVMCMATMFWVCCLMMVGTMFAVTSQYQDMIVATMINVSNHQLNTIDDEIT